MNGPPVPVRPRILTTIVFAASAGFAGLLCSLPFLLGPAIGVAGVLVSARWRGRLGKVPADVALVPGLGGVVAVLLASPATIGSELFGGVAVLAFLLWLADDPRAAPGGGRRAATSLSLAGAAFAVAWAIALVARGSSGNVGLAGILVVLGLLLVALVLFRGADTPTPETA